MLEAADLADGGAATRAVRTLDHGPVPGGVAGRTPHRRIGPPVRAADGEVVNDGRRHDRHPHRPRGVAAAVLLDPGYHAVGSGESERGPAGQQDRIDPRNEVSGAKRLDLATAGGETAHIAGGAERPEHDRAPGVRFRIGGVPDADAIDGGEPATLGSFRRHAASYGAPGAVANAAEGCG